MKKLLIIPFFLLFSCITAGRKLPQANENESKPNFRIMKLDSIENVYIIYAKQNGAWFKILSAKENLKSCKPVEIGKEYPLIIKSLFPRKFLGKHDLSPQALPHVSGLYFNGTPISIERDSITDLYSTENLKGLCFIKNK